MKKPPPESLSDTIERLQRQLARERQARRDAEQVAETSTRRLYREQLKLQAISQVATHAHGGMRLRQATKEALKALLKHTAWRYCRVVYKPFDNITPPVRVSALCEGENPLTRPGVSLTASARVWLEQASPLDILMDERITHEKRWPENMHRRLLCGIGIGEQCMGALELFSYRDDEDTTFSQEMVLALVRELAHIYKSERDRQAIERMAWRDVLTGALNRAAFFRDLETITIDTRPMALLYIDLAGFGEINEDYGHEIADRYLFEIARRLENEPLSRSVARLGSDEFVLLLPLIDTAHAGTIVRDLLADLTKPLMLDHYRIDPAFSAGLALYPEDASDGHALFYAADTALSHAREHGSTSLRRFDAEIAEQLERRKQLAMRVRQAVTRQEFVAFFQPIVSRDYRIVGAEALLRWQAPDAPGPAEFIPLLEEQGLIREVGRQMLHDVIHTAARWRHEQEAFQNISVNVSPIQLREEAFVNHVIDALKTSGLPASCLILEITESLYISAEKAVLNRLARLRQLGVRLALDDFGTGYSALSYLQWMPLDILKIDKSFVLKLAEEHAERDITIVRAIIQIAQACGLDVTAEGIESAEVARIMCELGAHCLQGYHFSRPLGEEAMTALLHSSAMPPPSHQPLID
ncbi:putative bifunctional diguanylate cyclase/phosphodiesterase [Kushneria indalinina]|uniref:Diguanylate cyclase (GGDEF)-like protein n=1 Tax=Kushneria indalinina DSM 14324 TaxID=1122140 RepID=A0A3D9DY40_9GAMM|nr:bifunctional diguanylate cyclase/phosphodiesterase [Kushneria indalinina]REC95611.1 diguanylate cyclase (GGDEF)-like protein [Kushneria indalinina DSM 14324]